MEEIRELYKALETVNVADVYKDNNGRVCVQINWGDWKHDHLRCDWLMSEQGYRFVESEVTEEDGSDTYSALRVYEKVEE